jgi:hypothetical protein
MHIFFNKMPTLAELNKVNKLGFGLKEDLAALPVSVTTRLPVFRHVLLSLCSIRALELLSML